MPDLQANFKTLTCDENVPKRLVPQNHLFQTLLPKLIEGRGVEKMQLSIDSNLSS